MLQEFGSVGKRYRLPRKVKKRFKTNFCKTWLEHQETKV